MAYQIATKLKMEKSHLFEILNQPKKLRKFVA
jgi:hypothetical protein